MWVDNIDGGPKPCPQQLPPATLLVPKQVENVGLKSFSGNYEVLIGSCAKMCVTPMWGS